MNRFRPSEAIIHGTRQCGLYVDVEAKGETHEIIETYLEDSEAAQVMSDTGEGIYIPNGDTTRALKVTSIAARLACDQCGKCPPQDYSVELEAPASIDEANIPELEATYAQAVVDVSNARVIAAYCILT